KTHHVVPTRRSSDLFALDQKQGKYESKKCKRFYNPQRSKALSNNGRLLSSRLNPTSSTHPLIDSREEKRQSHRKANTNSRHRREDRKSTRLNSSHVK